MTLNEKIGEILKKHEEGEEFFNALDYIIRGDKDILKDFYSFSWDNIFNSPSLNNTSYNLVMSGRFGLSMISNYGNSLIRSFNKVIVTNGNLRKGEEPEIYCNDFGNKPFIFLDDSYYSGKTKNSIQNKLLEIEFSAKIIKTLVIYDGSKELQPDVYSMYRYHK
jgi:hypothetical protein